MLWCLCVLAGLHDSKNLDLYYYLSFAFYFRKLEIMLPDLASRPILVNFQSRNFWWDLDEYPEPNEFETIRAKIKIFGFLSERRNQSAKYIKNKKAEIPSQYQAPALKIWHSPLLCMRCFGLGARTQPGFIENYDKTVTVISEYLD